METIDLLAQSAFSQDELARIEKHIDSCEQCRGLVESVSIDFEWQNEVLPALKPTSETEEVLDNQKADCQDEGALESILTLLGPTDDPHKLGRVGTC